MKDNMQLNNKKPMCSTCMELSNFSDNTGLVKYSERVSPENSSKT